MKKENLMKVVVINPPTKEQSEHKIKELSNFLSKTWYMSIKIK